VAAKRPRPGRTLISFFVGTAIAFGLVAIAGSWTPTLGLDLEGGTRLTLQAAGDPSSESLSEARGIIDQRVNGSGVSEAEVTTEGGNVITVEIPGESQRDLLETVAQQAQLRFRVVACDTASSPCPTPGEAGAGSTTTPVDPGAAPTTAPTPAPSGQPSAGASQSGQPQGQQGSGAASPAPRAPTGFGRAATPSPTDPPSAAGTLSPSASATGTPSASPGGSASASPGAGGEGDDGAGGQTDFDDEAVAPVDDALQAARNPSQAALSAFARYECDEDGTLVDPQTGDAADLPDNPVRPLVACSEPEAGTTSEEPDTPAIKYLLSPAVIEGTDLNDANAGTPQQGVGYVVTLDIGGGGRDVFGSLSRDFVNTGERFAIVLDGEVLSAPGFDGVITNGRAEISGNFNQTSANNLATSLRYGALPIEFADTSSELIGPSLAGDQLTAGLTAGAIGLALVMLYCLLYYRGLGLVVLASLVMAAALTYAMVLLLSETAGFTLTLPGIAGLIIAVGVTADSFIILFERIRDEMRDGKSMRVAVEAGWSRARNTCLAADAVSLLAAIVLYIFAAGVVKGFAFALGLSTLIDLVVFFFFTKPMVSWLARFRFFNSGHKLSGLSPETLGIDEMPGRRPRRPSTVGSGA